MYWWFEKSFLFDFIAPLRGKISKFVLGLRSVVTGQNASLKPYVHAQVSVDLPTKLLIFSGKSNNCNDLQANFVQLPALQFGSL